MNNHIYGIWSREIDDTTKHNNAGPRKFEGRQAQRKYGNREMRSRFVPFVC